MINQKPCLTVLVWDVKEPTHCSKRIGDVVPGVMAYHLFCSGDTCTCVSCYSSNKIVNCVAGADPENSERGGRDPYPPPQPQTKTSLFRTSSNEETLTLSQEKITDSRFWIF